MQEERSQVAIRWNETDPSSSITLAQCRNYREAKTCPLITTYGGLFKAFETPDPDDHEKDGSQFLIGPCPGRRANKNLERGFLFVIDADKSYDENHIEVDGAPDPAAVHEALKSWNLSHCIYTTYSHGPKGNRYRIVIPAPVSNSYELKASTLYIVELLNAHADLPLALSRESFVWAQGWNLPRIPYEGATYLCFSHIGVTADAGDLEAYYQVERSQTSKMPPAQHSGEMDPTSPIGVINRCLPIQQQLQEAGYEYCSQGLMLDQDDKEVPVFRYRKPGSTSAPGVAVFLSRDRWRAYSHHGGDPLNNGKSNDAFDVYQLLNGKSQAEALRDLVPVLQRVVEAELNDVYPSVLEGGVKFRYGNVYIDDLGAKTYRMLDQSAFTALMQNTPGVPTIEIGEDGEERLVMKNRAEYWLRCRHRTMYNGIVYHPAPILEGTDRFISKGGRPYFNIFGSWNLTPAKGKWPLLQWHLFNTICGEKQEEYDYFLNWFAHMFQCPYEKPQVAIVLQGGRGLGKTLLFSEISKALGSHSFIAGNNRLLTGNFNSHLRNRMLLVVEESFWSGNNRERGILQHIISDEVTGFEKKGFDAEPGLSYLRVAMISNNDWVVPAANDERRFFLPTVTEASKERDCAKSPLTGGDFFPALIREMRGGGLEAFVYDMAIREIDKQEVRKVPFTDKLIEQKEMSLDWIDKFLLHSLTDRTIKPPSRSAYLWADRGVVVPAELLRESLLEFAPTALGYTDRGLLTAFGLRVKKALGRNLVTKFSGPEGSRYAFGGIHDCRYAFERYAGFPIDWGLENKPEVMSAEETTSVRH